MQLLGIILIAMAILWLFLKFILERNRAGITFTLFDAVFGIAVALLQYKTYSAQLTLLLCGIILLFIGI